MSNKTKEQAEQHLEDNKLDNVQINSIKDIPYYVSDVMVDFALSFSEPVSDKDIGEIVNEIAYKQHCEEQADDFLEKIWKLKEWLRNTYAQKPQLTEAKVVEILEKHINKIPDERVIVPSEIKTIAKEITQ